ncbi:MAG: site-specific integrase [Patescibacteria group bacterium]|nr:site-specific integrase [Patescibacteria group bacterium]
MQKFSYLKEKEAIKATLSDEEIEAFLKLLPKRKGKKEGLNYNKWTLFFSLMAFTGMRSGEVASLKVDQVDFGRGIFVIEDSKTNTPRFVPIPPNIKTVLENYVKKCTGYLFPSPRNGKDGVVRNVDWGYQFHQRLNRLGIKRKYLTPYSLRHSFITRMLEEDVNIFKIQKIVGHRDLRTTAHYTHLTTKDIQRAITRHPIIRRSTEPITIIHSLVEMIKSFSIENDNRFFYRLEENNNGLRFELSLK